jgi:GNAT superfamily N-acetyltransferase
VEIRPATPDDLPKLPTIELSAAQAFRGTGVPNFILREATPAEYWVPLQAAGTVWVAEDQAPQEHAGGLVGYLGATREGQRLHVRQFDVILPAQGRGVGQRLLDHVIAWARAQGLAALSLTTFRSIPWNGPFYRSCGFVEWADALPEDIQAELAKEAANGLADRCAMRLDL